MTKSSNYREQAAPTGHVPFYVLLAIRLLIPILVACVNHTMVILDLNLLSWKFETAKASMESSGFAMGTLALIGVSVLFSSVAAYLVAVFAPACAGSGIPEVLGFLNGNQLPALFSLRSSIIRIIAIVFAQSAGFPIGREGPMIAIGGSVGFGVAYTLLRPYEQRSEKVISRICDRTGETYLATSPIIANQERFASARRIGCALGAASGIATAFNAPIGGILYMYEEAAVSGLMPKFHIFLGTVVSSFMARALLKVTNMDVHRLVIYDDRSLNQGQSWDWVDVPIFALLAALLGLAGGLNANACCRVWSFRNGIAKKLSKRQPYAKLCECIFWCGLCACLCSLMPAIVACTDDDSGHAKEPGMVEGHHRRLESSLNLVRHICPEGQHNQAATLLLQGAEGAVKHLYSHAKTVQTTGPLITTLITYGILAVGMPGLCVPMGLFIPNMLLGGLAGRLVGETVTTLFNSWGIACMPAGVYAVVGSAAMLAGFTHMTVGIVALLTEAINDLSLIMPLMMVVSMARFMSTFVTHHGYDEQIIIKKGVPFLDTEIPQEIDESRLTARDVCYIPHKEVMLPRRAKVRTIKRALRHRETNYFPILSEDGHCVGLTNRGRLKSVLKAVRDARPLQIPNLSGNLSGILPNNTDEHPCTHASEGTSEGLQFRRSSTLSTLSTMSDGSFDTASTFSSVIGPILDKMPMRRPSKRRKTEGRIGDQEVESRMKDAITDLFTDPERLHARCGDDEDPHDDHLLPVERVMDPAPYMISEAMPIQHFYSLFNNVSVNVVCVLSRYGTFHGIVTRRGLIDAASSLHGSHGKAPAPSNAVQDCQVQGRDEGQVTLPTCNSAGPVNVHAFEESKVRDSFRQISPGCILTPSETDAGSSDCFTEDTGDDESQHTPRVQLCDVLSGASCRKDRLHTTVSESSSPSIATSGCSGTAMTMADMLGPSELRVQLASAWARLAASEHEQENLRKKLRMVEQLVPLGHKELNMQTGGGEHKSKQGEHQEEHHEEEDREEEAGDEDEEEEEREREDLEDHEEQELESDQEQQKRENGRADNGKVEPQKVAGDEEE